MLLEQIINLEYPEVYSRVTAKLTSWGSLTGFVRVFEIELWNLRQY